MTTIKRFTPDYKMHAVRFEAFAREAEHGEYVRFDAHQQEVSALEAERDAQQKRANALAVENLAIKAMNDCLSEELRGYESDGAFEGPNMHHLWWKAETPATDAAVREIEARGVEKFAEFLDSPIAGQHCYQNEVGLARHFASTLREAK
ncbi:TPA: hypothetical protein ACQVG4_001755 [Serratia marcescens]